MMPKRLNKGKISRLKNQISLLKKIKLKSPF
jgi:hypothetical protein